MPTLRLGIALLLAGMLATSAGAAPAVPAPAAETPTAEPAAKPEKKPEKKPEQKSILTFKPVVKPDEDGEPTLPPDGSLEAADYVQLGMPPLDRFWSPADLAQAAKVLEDLVAKNPDSLPRFQSPKSGQVFAAMTARENYAFLTDKSVSAQDRAQADDVLGESLGRIAAVYVRASDGRAPLGPELVELAGAMLRATKAEIEFLGEVKMLAQFDNAKPGAGVKWVEAGRKALADEVQISLRILADRPIYRTADRRRLAGIMCVTFPTILAHAPPAVRRQAQGSLENLLADRASRGIVAYLKKLQEIANQKPEGDPLVPPDLSLMAEECAKLGLPSPEKTWSRDDLALATKLLGELVAQRPETLPRAGSERSGAYFALLVARQDMDAVLDPAVSPEARLAALAEYSGIRSQLYKTYSKAWSQGVVPGRDVAELAGSVLRDFAATATATDEVLATLKPDDPKYAARVAALDKTKAAAAEMVRGAIELLADRQAFRTADHVALIRAMDETVPTVLASLAPKARAPMLNRLDVLAKKPEMKDLAPEIERLLALARMKAVDHDTPKPPSP